jgi:hypothetical protein
MSPRLRAALPLAVAVGVIAVVWIEISLNFTFHWATSGDLGNGLALPGNVQLIPPAAFVSWAMFFAAGADRAAAGKVLLASAVGAVGGLILMLGAPQLAELPDFWGIAALVGVLAFVVVAASSLGDWYFTPGVFGGFATVVFWWITTGLDGWAAGGGGVGNSIKALGDPATAGAGAFGGVLSTPSAWVFVSSLVTLACGVLLGQASVKLAGVLTPSAPTREESLTRAS